MICSSVNLDFLIVRLLYDGLSIQMRDQTGLTSVIYLGFIVRSSASAKNLPYLMYIFIQRAFRFTYGQAVIVMQDHISEATIEIHLPFAERAKSGRSIVSQLLFVSGCSLTT